MIKPPSLGGLDKAIESDENVIISEYKLREFLALQLKLVSDKRRYLYVWESCIYQHHYKLL